MVDSVNVQELITKFGSKTKVLEEVWNMRTDYLTPLDIDNVLEEIVEEMNSQPTDESD